MVVEEAEWVSRLIIHVRGNVMLAYLLHAWPALELRAYAPVTLIARVKGLKL